MASALARRAKGSTAAAAAAALWGVARGFASVGSDIVSVAPGVSLQKARSWDEGVATKFSTTPLKDIFYVSGAASPKPHQSLLLIPTQQRLPSFNRVLTQSPLACLPCVFRGRRWSSSACL